LSSIALTCRVSRSARARCPSAPATAHIPPSSNAVAGDYQITLSASNTDANESIDVRVTVETSPIWGIVGILLVVATIGGLVLVFRRYGRR